ncbi:hypothetical protein QCA50_001142 [Cerrena zonata]|uniref:C2H2-type domain-containing protein n=1 Tax=Cerrena zonata TaxID=2478898 RepID=A0AAW0GYN6_9APHY
MSHTQRGSSPQQSPSPSVSLPSFREMFPEYTVASGSIRRRSGTSADMMQDRRCQAPRAPPHDKHSEQYSVDARRTTVKIGEGDDRAVRVGFPTGYRNSDMRRPEPYNSVPNHDRTPTTSGLEAYHTSNADEATSSCFFDVLRPHPFTSDLEHIASTSDVTTVSRGHQPYPSSYSVRTAPHAITTSNAPSRTHPPELPSSSRNGPSSSHHSGNANRPSGSNPNHSYHANPHGVVMSLPSEPSDDKKHCCPQCQKRFNRPSSLKIHVNTHTGVKPFSCSFPGCTRRFNVNSNMRRHYRNHFSGRRQSDFIYSNQPMNQGPPQVTTSQSFEPVTSTPSPRSTEFGSRSPSPEFDDSEEEY